MRIFKINFSLEVSMNWIDERAEKHIDKIKSEEEKEYRIQSSNYWSDLRLEIEKNVEQINNHEHWKKYLRDVPLKIDRSFSGNGYEIKKRGFPQVFVVVDNNDDEIEVITSIRKDDKTRSQESKEIFKVDVKEGGQVFLKGNNETLVLPEQAAQYILTPILNELPNS